MIVFFFSSRRRHTRSKRDWSSDVCSSDLFGSKRDFDGEGYYVSNAMFPKLQEELKVDEDTIALTQRYLLIKEPLLTGRVEELEEDSSLAYLLDDDDAVVIGPNTEHPF